MDVQRGAVAPAAAGRLTAGQAEAIDAALAALTDRAPAWAATSPTVRAELLARVVEDTRRVAEEWNAAACAAKGLDPRGADGAEELFSGVGTFVRLAQVLRRGLLELARDGRPRYPGPVRHVPGERLAIRVVPATTFEKFLYFGLTAEVWQEPGQQERDVRDGQAAAYREPRPVGVSLVLGAGNVASLGPRDVLNKLFAEGHVVYLKANPVNDYLVPYWRRAMAALVEGGFLVVEAGDAAAGEYLVRHDLVSDVHVTGSDKTHDAIVFGAGEEGARRRAANEPLVTKPVSAELGNVSPVIIVPGAWTRRELEFQARHVATMIANNASFNCLTPRVLVTHEGWAQRENFLDALEAMLATIPARRAYYPGAEDRHATFVAAHPEATMVGARAPGVLPWTIVRGVDPERRDDLVFNVESFCAMTAETALPADDAADFVARAAAFCNDQLWGTLAVTILADPRALKDPVTGPAIEQAVADLRYGSIGVNVWHALTFVLGTTTWGAYPGHPITDVQSGRGVVGNAYLFARPQKSVVRGPFTSRPDPSWFLTARHADTVMRRLLDFEARPRWRKLPALMLAALRG